MMKNKTALGIVLLLAVAMIAGCVDNQPATSSAGVPIKTPARIQGSVEQDNINKRLQIVNSPSTTMWFYGLSETGAIIFKSVVVGKVTSSGKRLEPVSCNGCATINRNGGMFTDELLQADGTFGSSDDYVYWFDFQGNYFQWNGKYILTTTPLRIPTPTIEFQTTEIK